MALPSFEELFQRADQSRKRVPVAVAGGQAATVVEALASAADRGWVEPLIFEHFEPSTSDALNFSSRAEHEQGVCSRLRAEHEAASMSGDSCCSCSARLGSLLCLNLGF